jgi:hypothetical protein
MDKGLVSYPCRDGIHRQADEGEDMESGDNLREVFELLWGRRGED